MMTLEQWRQRWKVPKEAMIELTNLYLPVTPQPTDTFEDSEASTSDRLRLKSSEMKYSLWRNNNGAVTTDDGRHVRFGLGNVSAKINKYWKSPDLVGIGPGGRFVGCEVKEPGWTVPRNDRDYAQMTCLHQINLLGGIGFFATHVDHYTRQMQLAAEGKI